MFYVGWDWTKEEVIQWWERSVGHCGLQQILKFQTVIFHSIFMANLSNCEG